MTVNSIGKEIRTCLDAVYAALGFILSVSTWILRKKTDSGLAQFAEI